MISIQESVARKPETIRAQLVTARANGLTEVCECLEMLLSSSASNDYLEKIAVESIGGTHSTAKLGADGLHPDGSGIEAKPHKGETKSDSGGCINDDTPMKLKRDHETVRTIVFLNATKSGDKVRWIVAAPFRYWTPSRFAEIASGLGASITWNGTTEALDALVACHKKKTYVRSNPLSLRVLSDIPAEECAVWVHPDLSETDLPKSIQSLVQRQRSPPPQVSEHPDVQDH